jgi:hypothetical protein
MPDGEFVRQVRASSEEAHQYLPTDHPARGGYRVAARLAALLLAVVGVVALVTAGDVPFAGRAGHGFLGLSLNRAGGVLLLVLAVVVLAAASMRGNAGAGVLTGVGVLILLLGLLVLAVNRTGANVFAFSVIDVCALWIPGLVVLWGGMHSFQAEQHRTLLGDQTSEYREPSR